MVICADRLRSRDLLPLGVCVCVAVCVFVCVCVCARVCVYLILDHLPLWCILPRYVIMTYLDKRHVMKIFKVFYKNPLSCIRFFL